MDALSVYLLDTDVVSELRKTRPHGSVLAWFSGEEDDRLLLSVVTLAEIQAGSSTRGRGSRRHRLTL